MLCYAGCFSGPSRWKQFDTGVRVALWSAVESYDIPVLVLSKHLILHHLQGLAGDDDSKKSSSFEAIITVLSGYLVALLVNRKSIPFYSEPGFGCVKIRKAMKLHEMMAVVCGDFCFAAYGGVSRDIITDIRCSGQRRAEQALIR